MPQFGYHDFTKLKKEKTPDYLQPLKFEGRFNLKNFLKFRKLIFFSRLLHKRKFKGTARKEEANTDQ